MAAPPEPSEARRTTIPWKPACMDGRELAAWQAANLDYARWRGRRRINVPRPCVDCTIDFATEMRLEGRCNGEPGQDPTSQNPNV